MKVKKGGFFLFSESTSILYIFHFLLYFKFVTSEHNFDSL